MPDPTPPQASNPPAAAAAPAAAAVPETLEVVYNGQKRVLSMDEAKRLAQIGLSDSLRRDRLVQLQQEMKAKEPLIKAAEELGALNKSNPAAGHALMASYEAMVQGRASPEQVLAALRGQQQQVSQEEGVAPTSAVDARTSAAIQRLESQLASVASVLEKQQAQASASEITSELTRALAADPFLSPRPAALKKAVATAKALVAEGRSMEEATNLASQEIRDILSETATAERDRRLAGNEMRTIPPTAGVPPTRDFAPQLPDKAKATSPEAYVKAGWAASKAAAKDYIRQALRVAAQGPNA